ncbi:MAG: hypothetical protein WDN31_12290 [Hyphomicrobium sp.]
MSDQPPLAKQNRSIASYAWLAALAALAAFAAVYVTLGRPDNQGASPQIAEAPPASLAHPLATGTMTTFVFKPAPAALPDIQFLNASGESVRLATFRGKGRAPQRLGRPGAGLAARRCRPSTDCRRRSAPTGFRSSPCRRTSRASTAPASS